MVTELANLPLAEDIPIAFNACWHGPVIMIVINTLASDVSLLCILKLCFVSHRTGKVITELANLPLADDIPIAFNSCRQGPRSLGWRSDKPAELYWTEAQVPCVFWLH